MVNCRNTHANERTAYAGICYRQCSKQLWYTDVVYSKYLLQQDPDYRLTAGSTVRMPAHHPVQVVKPRTFYIRKYCFPGHNLYPRHSCAQPPPSYSTEQGCKGSGLIREVRQALLFLLAHSAVITGNAGCHCL